MAPNPENLKTLKLRLAQDRRPGDMAQMDDWERDVARAVEGTSRLMLGSAFLLGLSFGCGLALGYVFWGLSA
jgi:hypothetical protein